jgi:hypothetical protein
VEEVEDEESGEEAGTVLKLPNDPLLIKVQGKVVRVWQPTVKHVAELGVELCFSERGVQLTVVFKNDIFFCISP